MTREEAIAELNVLHERLSNPKDCEDGCYSWEDGWYVEAIDMAIEALSQPIVAKCYEIDKDRIYCSPELADKVFKVLHEDTNVQNMHNGDLISRADGTWLTEYTEEEAEKEFPNIAKYNTSTDLISRADAIEAIQTAEPKDREYHYYKHFAVKVLEELPSAEMTLQTPQTYGKSINPSNAEVVADYINRVYAIEAVAQQWLFEASAESPYVNDDDIDDYRKLAEELLSDIPSAEAEPTVIRSKTLLPTKDFKEWAKRIKEVNPNAVVIPCDAEVASAEAAQTQAEKCDECIHKGVHKDKMTCKECVSAEAVEVVRCKDCKHKYVSGNGTTQYYVCDFMDAQYEENGFCHHAESEVKE